MSAPTRRAGSARAGRGGLTTRHARESYAPCLTRFVLQQTWAACYRSKRPLLLFAVARSLTDRRYPRGASLTRQREKWQGETLDYVWFVERSGARSGSRPE